MNEYLSYFSAATLWNIPYIETVLGPEITETNSVDLTVSKRSERSLKKGQIVHLCELALPTGAVISRKGKMVASPELLFR